MAVELHVTILHSNLGRLRGGIETRAARMAEELARRGHEVALVGARWPGRSRLFPDLARLPVRWLAVPCPPIPHRFHTWFYLACRLHPEARRLLASADVTLTFAPGDTALFSAWRQRAGLPHVSFFPGGNRRWLQLDRSTVRVVNPMVARKNRHVADFPIDGELPPGVPQALLQAPYEVRPRAAELLFVGRLEPNKGVVELLRLFRSLACERPDLRLRLLGDGPLRQHLRRQAAADGLEERIDFAGAVPPEEVWRRMREADLLVFPTHGENFPLSLLEAQAVGLPFVSSDIEGIRGTVHPGGALLALGDEPQWERTVRSLLDDTAARRAMSEEGRRWAAAYTWEKTAERLEEYLRLAVERSGRVR
ncbi:MAG: hypothetical protein QOH06_731 [Acidobacteriota bacterium]|jgi:glycosyltransferase involved in cell wall biosynthesis|nr:hypothetical protein [Acidobacteriota bacterium]